MSDATSRLALPVRIGIIGCGNVLGAYRTAIERLCSRGQATVTAACGRDSQRETAAAALPVGVGGVVYGTNQGTLCCHFVGK